ncbi:4Fe-4S binding protein [Olsenella sp. HMSC062G07]|uniref:4Fe-4S binding protein n=1 Tax=Olsenella sp. HMSC062G07 TaxID=1739330 RepID=UPI0009F5E794
MRRTRHLWAGEDCVGCGLCARTCPVEAMRIERGRSRWVADCCAMCPVCLRRCPTLSIQHGLHTKAHGQNRHHTPWRGGRPESVGVSPMKTGTKTLV